MQEETDYIYGIPKFSRKTSLANTSELIRRLGAETAAEIIHVAGTNGKGSVCSYLDSILRQGGFCVGLFTSPHLIRINERIAVNGEQVGDSEFEESFARVKEVSDEMLSDGFSHPSFFEFLFGMAMDIFSRRRLDYIILETGLGGRLDATNIFEKPRLTVITSVGFDHTEILGNTLGEIAAEKAGIIKPGVPVVFEDINSEVTEKIACRAKALGAPMHILEPSHIRDIRTEDKRIDFLLHNGYYCNERFTLASLGLYQAENAALAAVAAAVLGTVDIAAVKRGLAMAFWMGRMQETASGLVVDGAHNEDGIRSFIASVAGDGGGKRVLIFSAVRDKHYQGMIEALCGSGLFDRFIIAPLRDSRGLDAKTMRQCFEKYSDRPAEVCAGSGEAYRTALSYMADGFRAYSAGSLYLAGEILALAESESTPQSDGD